MNKILPYLFSLSSIFAFGQSYAPAAGQPGSTAIAHDDTRFVAWATKVEIQRGYINISDTSATYDGSNRASFGLPENATGPATNVTTDVVSLGDSGIAIVTFDQAIKNGNGPDFAVFENGLTDTFLELAHVEVSSDGVNYFRFPSHSETQTNTEVGSFGSLDPTYLYNLAGKYKVGFGTPFDLEDLKNENGLNVNAITHIKIIDVIGSIGEHATFDAYGNKINDLFPTAFNSGGFDLAAIGIINEAVLSLNDEKSYFKVYPNPSTGFVNIKTKGKSVSEICITDQLGKRISTKQLKTKNEELSIDLPKGMYFIHFISNTSTHVERLIVQ